MGRLAVGAGLARAARMLMAREQGERSWSIPVLMEPGRPHPPGRAVTLPVSRGHRHWTRRGTDVRPRAGFVGVVLRVHRGDASCGDLPLLPAADVDARPAVCVHVESGDVFAGRGPVRGDRSGSRDAALVVVVSDVSRPWRVS